MVKFKCENGNHTVSKTALGGLMYWNLDQGRPIKLPDNLPSFCIVNCGNVISEPNDLFVAAVAACERIWNKAPLFDISDDEEKALFFLKWLREFGNIVWLEIDGEEWNSKR